MATSKNLGIMSGGGRNTLGATGGKSGGDHNSVKAPSSGVDSRGAKGNPTGDNGSVTPATNEGDTSRFLYVPGDIPS